MKIKFSNFELKKSLAKSGLSIFLLSFISLIYFNSEVLFLLILLISVISTLSFVLTIMLFYSSKKVDHYTVTDERIAAFLDAAGDTGEARKAWEITFSSVEYYKKLGSFGLMIKQKSERVVYLLVSENNRSILVDICRKKSFYNRPSS